MKHLSVISVLVCLLSVCYACNKVPSHIIPEEKMAEIMADINVGNAIVEAERGKYPTDSSKLALTQSIYARHGVTAEDVDTSFVWYGHHIEQYIKVCERAEEILNTRIADAELAAGKTATSTAAPTTFDGDSVNIWTVVSPRRVTGTEASDIQNFSFFSDRNWDRGDRYTLSAKGINTHGTVAMYLAADYNDGTTEYVSLIRPAEDMHRLLLVVDSAKVTSRVYGSLIYTGTKGEVAYLDSISLVRTRGRNDNVAARKDQLSTRNR